MRQNYINCTQEEEYCECGSLILPACMHSCIELSNNDYELACKAYKRVNLYLTALGANIHKSINMKLKYLKRNNLISEYDLNAIQYIINERNKLIHDTKNKLTDRDEFIRQMNYLF